MKIKLDLLLENTPDSLQGRVSYNGTELVENASSVEELEQRMRVLLNDFESLNPDDIEFVHVNV